MRILILSDRIPPEHVGGAEKFAWGLAVSLHQAGYEVHVVAATPNASFREIRGGIPTYHLHSRYPERLRSWLSLYNPQVFPGFKSLLQEIKPDIVHAFNVHTDLSYASLLAAKKAQSRVIFTAQDLMPIVYGKMKHYVDPNSCEVRPEEYRLPRLYNLKVNRLRYNPLRNRFIRYILMTCTQVRTALSQVQKTALEVNQLPPFEVVPNGIDPQPFECVSETLIEEMRQEYGLQGQRVVLFGGRMSEDKGSRQLVLALDEVIRQIPEVRLLVLSARQVNSNLLNGLAQFNKSHISEGGWLMGERLVAAYHLADVVVYPSIYLDPFGMINLEAMAARKPVVASCYGGAADIVVNGETGYIINPFNSAEFAARLLDLLTNQPLCQQMGEAGWRRLSEFFTMTRQRDVMLEFYRRTLAL